MASWGSYVFELCRINANQGLTAEIDWNYTSWSRRCRKILIGLVVRGAKTVVVRGKNRILTRNRKKPEMTVPISHCGLNLRPPPTYRLRSTFGDLRYGSRRGAVNCQPRSKRHSRKLAQHRAPLAKSVERAARTLIRRCMAMHPRPVPAPNALGVA